MNHVTLVPNVVDIDEEDVNPVLDEEGLEQLNTNFGKGINKRRILVGPAHTLKSIKKMSE